ncbi:Asp-tRNA(Asn)/Glu-tRNA(Gln) amidotransferase subunit GatC [Cytophaga hutchinsonii]|jgi:aspartyl-tRNA(Asn)/glutamyl-tRNA(Gln) amidotransferase subunit C|uniref:Aspartyl/glutamyl-tRNA(Asn/Gln) amidotransferase subunit C n=1 Tax=Cytophaga hutchinsonii (strain ATCC 33406 / DSM 1761 / CIP 103989 / NBRC 15051 / NCIMB 9469 / D465) TaxID=269798 RepID=GATC_CYTH3|nr:Asp-tRNA(Asn)/Glu-tRNA(Gln) amidotransferase subunit GatC [Cytophaga hutchinsonii]Q11R87.1 RecName: Full=Aspartyl/glutamyl-tRNA(Asn/Gln) amidotransferase subunit C; Short=Asp/Glu-ADT subunit C [Cytophaga hutchinsonii ATCC 33406]ABG60077.1 aspartyl/glutamyl-tRNA(Asn/Gln) amidotransferase subunit C [Cytophaga hutchinsonii ATCC 33406]SFX24600.1 aspartyl/glutamyl-tRNA(Asn/Gln) amidotransferase subunit C [Cytophaga hutchinsonii ATCC 33406]
MSLDTKTIGKIAHLARLEFDDKSLEAFSTDFNKILSWIDKLNEVNTDNVEPLIHMSHELNVLREDIDKVTISHEEALKNAPKKDSDYFRVPKFLS